MGRTYLYGMVESPEEAIPGIPGVVGTRSVYLVPGDGVGCVVSDYIGEELQTLPKEELVRRLLAHQQVVEFVMQGRTVLPVKFGTTLEGPEEVRALLAQAHLELGQALEQVRDKVEVEVAATWDLKRVLQEAGQEQDVVRAREAIVARGSPTLEDRAGLGQVVKACLDRRRDAYRERMLAVLRPQAVDMAPNALLAEEMVMNVAFLVRRARQQEFAEQVQVLDSLFDNQVTFRVIGPLPPYSFSTVQVMPLSAEQVERALRELELPDVVGAAEVRRAYRRLAALEQRKVQRGVKASADGLTGVRRASEVLLRWCRVQASHPPAADGGPSGAHEKRPRLFFVAVRGTGYQEIDAARFGATVRV